MANKVICRYCRNKVDIGVMHLCRQMQTARKHEGVRTSEDNRDFFVPLAVALASNDWMLGAVVGASLASADGHSGSSDHGASGGDSGSSSSDSGGGGGGDSGE